MRNIEHYRAHAHDCLRRAHADINDNDKPLWLTLAQSWLQLAEHADRINGERDFDEQQEETSEAS